MCFSVGYLKYHVLLYHPARYHFLIQQSSEFLCLREFVLYSGVSHCCFAAVSGCCSLWCSWRFLCFSFQQAAFELLWPPFLYGASCSDVLHLLPTGSTVTTLSKGKMLEWCPGDQGVFPVKRQFLQIPVFFRNFPRTLPLFFVRGACVKRLCVLTLGY